MCPDVTGLHSEEVLHLREAFKAYTGMEAGTEMVLAMEIFCFQTDQCPGNNCKYHRVHGSTSLTISQHRKPNPWLTSPKLREVPTRLGMAPLRLMVVLLRIDEGSESDVVQVCFHFSYLCTVCWIYKHRPPHFLANHLSISLSTVLQTFSVSI